MKTKLITPAIIAIAVISIASCSKKNSDDITNLKPYRYDVSQAQGISQTAITAPTTLEDRVNGVDYIITSNINVSSALVIKPGVTIMFEKGAGITVQPGGSLKAIGTGANEIYFTPRDNKRGSWRGITILSRTSDNVLEHCLVELGGGETDGNIVIGNSNTTAMASVTNTQVSTSKTAGIYAYPGSVLNHFTGNTFSSNTEYGLALYIADAGSIKDENIFNGNGKEYVLLTTGSGIVDHPVLLNKLRIPYLLREKVVAGNVVQINEGAKIIMDETAGITVDGLHGSNASVIIKGTASSPVTIEGIYNAGQPGVWEAITIRATSRANVIENAVISGGGIATASPNGMINVVSGEGYVNITLRNNKIMNSAGVGLYLQASRATYNQDIVTGNIFSGNLLGDTKFE